MARLSPTARSLFALVDGFLLFVALQGIFYAIAFLGLHVSFDTPTRAYLASNFGWAVLSALIAGYLTARVAQRRPLLHGLVLAVPFLALSLYNFSKGAGGIHTVFVVSFNTLVPLSFVLGAALAARRPTH